jgi:hypothetical protein
MKRTIAAIALFVASCFITAGVLAQSVKATVPFDFTVSSYAVPAGTYTITPSSSNDTLLNITNWQKKVRILSMAQDNAGKTGRDNVMVFHRYGDQYFLTEIRSETAAMNLYFPPSKAEMRAKWQTQVAGLPVSSDVIVAIY